LAPLKLSAGPVASDRDDVCADVRSGDASWRRVLTSRATPRDTRAPLSIDISAGAVLPPDSHFAARFHNAHQTVLDRLGTRLAQLAHGIGVRPARYGGPLASRLAAPPMDTAIETATAGPSPDRSSDPHVVREMATADPLWGALRIHGELQTLGVDVSERAVSQLLAAHTRPRSQTWKTYLTNHLSSAAAVDFLTVPTLTGRVLFVLVVLSHCRRRIVHFNVTEHPTTTWAAQQVVEAFPDDTAPKWLHRDRDSIYSESFRRRVAGMDIAEVISAPASPWQNPYVERLIGSIRRECLDHMIVLKASHLRNILTMYGR
jgi:putative transposase